MAPWLPGDDLPPKPTHLQAPSVGPSLLEPVYAPGERQAKAVIPQPAQKKPSETQIGGTHYKLLAIQPMEYALANHLNYAQANAIKYITRYNLKADGSRWREDLEKAIHGLQMLIEWEEKQRNV